jgi:hypothetical protein
MTKFGDARRFSNHRRWQEFIAAVTESVTYPYSVTYPMIIGALRRTQVISRRTSGSIVRGMSIHCSALPAGILPGSIPRTTQD